MPGKIRLKNPTELVLEVRVETVLAVLIRLASQSSCSRMSTSLRTADRCSTRTNFRAWTF